MLEIVAVLIAVILVVLVIIIALAARKPQSFKVQRVLSMQAPPEKIFALVEDFHRWGLWSPYENRDPAMRRTFSGAERGKGAVYAWEGNKNVGSGRMEILESNAPSAVLIKLDFFKPFEGHNQAEFTMLPQDGATLVSWTMHGPAPFATRLMQVFVDLDVMIGKDFEAGLTNLKKIVEA